MSIVTEILKIRVLAYFAESSGIRNGVIVSSLDPGSSGPGSCPDRGYCAVFFGQDTSFHLSPHQQYKWVPTKGNLTRCVEPAGKLELHDRCTHLCSMCNVDTSSCASVGP